MDKDQPGRVLVVAAHPDDIDIGAAGTIAQWRGQGAEVVYVVVTDGDAGGFDLTVDRQTIPAIRRNEQLLAANAVGVETVEFLGYRDGEVVADLGLRRDISRLIRRYRPDRVVCPSPERDLSRIPASHPDHLAVGEATLCAIYPDARNPFAFPELLAEGLEAHTVHDVWLMAHPASDHFVDITDTFEDKLSAVAAHESQLIDVKAVLGFIRAWTEENALAAGFEKGRLAEAFFVVAVP